MIQLAVEHPHKDLTLAAKFSLAIEISGQQMMSEMGRLSPLWVESGHSLQDPGLDYPIRNDEVFAQAHVRARGSLTSEMGRKRSFNFA
jgi:hypothetical protein